MGVKSNYTVNLNEVMQAAFKASGSNQHRLAVSMGYAQSAGVATIIKRGEAKISTITRWADELGYDLVLQPKGQLAANEIKISVQEKITD